MKKLLLFMLIPIGLAGGLGAGYALKPHAEQEDAAGKAGDPWDADVDEEDNPSAGKDADLKAVEPASYAEPLQGDPEPVDYVKLDRQFVVPLIRDSKVSAMVVISMAIEAEPGSADLVFLHEPKLRDVFLQVLFTHAQSGGFEGAFTNEKALADLRFALNVAAQSVIGKMARKVLLTSVVKQDV